jgi:hypothetical protein
MKDIDEIAVTGPQSPKLAALDDFAGQEIFPRKPSSSWEHVEQLNERNVLNRLLRYLGSVPHNT